MAAPSNDVFHYAFTEPFQICLTNGTVFATVNAGITFEFEREVNGDPHWYTAYEIVGGSRGGRLFRIAFEENDLGVVPTF